MSVELSCKTETVEGRIVKLRMSKLDGAIEMLVERADNGVVEVVVLSRAQLDELLADDELMELLPEDDLVEIAARNVRSAAPS